MGQPLVFPLQWISSEQRWRMSPLRVLSECDLVFSALWAPCTVIWQWNRGLGDVIVTSAETLSRLCQRSEITGRKGSFPLGWGYGNKTASERQENTGQQPELICTVTSSRCRIYSKWGEIHIPVAKGHWANILYRLESPSYPPVYSNIQRHHLHPLHNVHYTNTHCSVSCWLT